MRVVLRTSVLVLLVVAGLSAVAPAPGARGEGKAEIDRLSRFGTSERDSTSDTASAEAAPLLSHGESTGWRFHAEGGTGPEIAWVATYAGPEGAYGSDYIQDMEVDGEGNIYVTGRSADIGGVWDYATVKYDSSGNELWVSRYNGPGDNTDWPRDVALGSDGSIYVTGQSVGADRDPDIATIKYGSDGSEQWVARYDGAAHSNDVGYAMVTDAFGNLYVTGASREAGSNISDADYITIKYGPDGNEQWVANYNGPGDGGDSAVAISLDSAGNVYITGISTGIGTGGDYATIKYDIDGIEQWIARYDGPAAGYDLPHDLAVDSSGNVFVTGQSDGSGTSSDYATVKYSSNGTQEWVARYDGPASLRDGAFALAVDSVGNVFVGGASTDFTKFPGGRSYATVKYNAVGTEQWVARYYGPCHRDNVIIDLSVDVTGSVYVTGRSTAPGICSTTRTFEIATLKYDPEGSEKWVTRYIGCTSPSKIVLMPEGRFYVAGTFGCGAGSDFGVLAYGGASPPPPPAQHKVLLVDGIGTRSICEEDPNNPDWLEESIAQKTWKLRQHLTGDEAGYSWLGRQTGLAQNDFYFYEYTDRDQVRDGCPGNEDPQYGRHQSCWSINDRYRDAVGIERDVSNGGQGRRFADYVKSILDDPANQNVKLSIIGWSQGGVIAAYAIDEGLLPPEYHSRITSVTTIDSPFGSPAESAGPNLVSVGCFGDFQRDSARDYSAGSGVIAHLRDEASPCVDPSLDPCVRLFNIDEDPGNVGFFEFGVREGWTQLHWRSGFLIVGAQDHGDAWQMEFVRRVDDRGRIEEKNRFLRFLGCALAAGSICEQVAEARNSIIYSDQPAYLASTVSSGTSWWTVQATASASGTSAAAAAAAQPLSVGVPPEPQFMVSLVSPSGTPYDGGTLPPGASYEVGEGFERFVIPDPEPGEWTIELATASTDPAGVTVSLSESVTWDPSVDADQDGLADAADNCPDDWNPSQQNTDSDVLGDACDNDIDGDTIKNDTDNCLYDANTGQADVDDDGLGDACDDDSDNDMLADVKEDELGTDPKGADSDGDGLIDGAEVHFVGTDPLNADTDADGLPDGAELNTHSTDPLVADTDDDGCMDGQELGPKAAFGGLRDPLNFWDFFDTPGADNGRDSIVSAPDIARIVARFGSSGSEDIAPLSAPDPAPAYHTAFDRTPAGDAPNGRAQGPNGSVSAQDIALIVLQFGHTCA